MWSLVNAIFIVTLNFPDIIACTLLVSLEQNQYIFELKYLFEPLNVRVVTSKGIANIPYINISTAKLQIIRNERYVSPRKSLK